MTLGFGGQLQIMLLLLVRCREKEKESGVPCQGQNGECLSLFVAFARKDGVDRIIFTLSLRAQATNGMILCVFREWKDEIRVGDARVAIF